MVINIIIKPGSATIMAAESGLIYCQSASAVRNDLLTTAL